MITQTWKNVYDSIVETNHTGDTNWTTALNVTGRGKAQIILDVTADRIGEIRITLDGAVLVNGIPCSGTSNMAFRTKIEWQISCLIEYRTNNAAETTDIEILYFNK